MDRQDPDSPKLTEHDKKVLRKIIDQAKVPDSDIARSIGISPQAVFKIRNKLEHIGVIKGYMPIVDFKKIGVNIMVVMIIRLSREAWKKFTDAEVSERISKIPHVVAAYRVTDVKASHILIMGFKDTYQKEKYITRMQTKSASEIEIIDTYTFSVDKIIVQNPLGLLYNIIDKEELSEKDFLL